VNLYPLNRKHSDNRYCGPAVVSFLTGRNTSDIARDIRDLTGRRAIIGTNSRELSRVLSASGLRLSRRPVSTPKSAISRYVATPTLATWLRDHKHIRTSGRVFLISAGNHWQLITGRRYACGRIGEIVSVRDSRVKRRARVREVFEIIK
jgi:hypothetical protein